MLLKLAIEPYLNMTDYFQALDPVAKARYTEKLLLVGLSEQEDPYKLWKDGKLKDNMKLWPPVEYGHIFCYFVDRPGVFTKQQLLQWKSMEAFNYFKSGHVHEVLVYRLPSTQSCILMAFVNPSQKSPDKAPHSWVAVKFDGTVITAHCTCMAGYVVIRFDCYYYCLIYRLGEGCSHTAAVLFKIECAVRNGYTVGTSSTCDWNQLFSTKV